MRAQQVHQRADLFEAQGVLRVCRPALPQQAPTPGQPPFVFSHASEGDECLLAVWDDGSVTALHGHVDLGTGLRTALTQLVAEELHTDPSKVHLLMGLTAVSPNQGATIASASIQIHAAPLRAAAAQARQWLIAQAAQRWALPPSEVQLQDGEVFCAPHGRLPWAALLNDLAVDLLLQRNTELKQADQHQWVGQSLPRVDIPAKVFADLIYVHDMRMPGMLHGRVVRPPYAGADSGAFIGHTLDRVEASSIAHIPGIHAVVVQGDFVGVVAEREEHAEQAMRELQVHWKPWPGMPGTHDLENAIRSNPSTPREVVNEGLVDEALADAAHTLQRTYVWPYQMHASIGPSCAVAWWHGLNNAETPHRLLVWAGTQNPHALRADVARLCGLHDTEVNIIRMEAAGCYGRNGADDVAADAALLSKAVGAPVRVQLTREQEHLWEPKGAAQLMQVRGGLGREGQPSGYDFQTSYPSNGATTLALLLTRTVEPIAQAFEMGDRTARPPYNYADLRVTVNDMPPILRASWLRGVSALPNSFAHESFIDELATAAGADPVQYRLAHLADERAKAMVQATADKAGWQAHTQPQQRPSEGDWLVGQGVAYARYIHSKWPGFGAAWAAWVADVRVHKTTGEVQVQRVVVGHDAGMVVNPKGVEQQIHGNVLQTTSRALLEQVQTDATDGRVTSAEWGSYPILQFPQVPVIEVVQMPRPLEDPLGAGESSSVPGTAAIANAIFDATGIRFRQPPFTPEVVRAALNPLAAPVQPTPQASRNPDPAPSSQPGWAKGWTWPKVGGALLALAAFTAASVGWRSSLPRMASPLAPVSQAVLARGAEVAALGNCVTCHTSDQGEPFAGGKAFNTGFGTVYSSNLTPDADTGLGAWTYQAFERAMRQGISRDGHALYPAFPYTAFASISDDDMTALYAWLMQRPAVSQATPQADMGFPFGMRSLMLLWNGLFHQPSTYQYDPAQTAQWNRGEYLVNGAAHCGACHTPRNALGAEQKSSAFLQGAVLDGWQAPALTSLNPSPVAWRTEDFFHYLRHGYTDFHGVASGPMAQVVRNLQTVPDADLQAMAVYLASLQTAAPLNDSQQTAQAQQLVQQAAALAPLPSAAQRQFEGSCGACHHDGSGPQLLGVNQPLALNGNLHSATPDNLVQVIQSGIQQPPSQRVGFMPGFKDSLSEAQMLDLVGWMRQRFAPDKPAWSQAQIREALRQSAKADY
jgi:nicotinate dehydrogenase subunit B